ncbi:hypothetical protein RJ641_028854 [Dillenia turbinata]|uniref:RING-type domain-containing protein n=1 Tax=Dillenia turbinata TaxID=194707 RepID=A0AAN8VQI1_9MAGN
MAVQAQFCSSDNICVKNNMRGSSQDWFNTYVPPGIDDFFVIDGNLHQPLRHMSSSQLLQNQRIQHVDFDANQMGMYSSGDTTVLSMTSSQYLASQVDKQMKEIDGLLRIQNERLRQAMQEQRKKQLAYLLTRFETAAMNLMRQKDEDLAKATKQTIELEDSLRKAELENEAWQRVAKENEAMVIDLNNNLQQAREKLSLTSTTDDAESCCDENRVKNRADSQVIVVAEEEELGRRMVCKCCDSQNSCIVFFPCRHLCCCKACEPFLGFCPVCTGVKKASMEVFLF